MNTAPDIKLTEHGDGFKERRRRMRLVAAVPGPAVRKRFTIEVCDKIFSTSDDSVRGAERAVTESSQTSSESSTIVPNEDPLRAQIGPTVVAVIVAGVVGYLIGRRQ